MATGSDGHQGKRAGGHDRAPGRSARHNEAILQAEARKLARALRPFGVLHRDALEELVDASKWHDGWFNSALDQAVRAGEIEEIAGGYLRDPGLPHSH